MPKGNRFNRRRRMSCLTFGAAFGWEAREEEKRSRSFELGFGFAKDLIDWLCSQFTLAVRLVASFSFLQPNCFCIDILSGIDTRNEVLRQQRTILRRQVPRLLLKLCD